MSNDDLPIDVATFQDKTDTTPQPWRGSWAQFRERMMTHTIRAEKDGKLWSPTIYKPSTTRKNENVWEITAAVGDFDSGITYGSLLPRISTYEHIVHSTHSHTPEHSKFRIVIPFARPVPAAEWPDVNARIGEHVFGKATDAGTKDAARMFYLPSSSPGVEHFARHNPGELLDPYALPPASTPAVPAESAGQSEERTALKVPLGKATLDFVENGAPIGKQRTRALAAVRNYLSAGYSEKDTAEAIWRGLQASPRDPAKEPWSKDAAIALVQDLARKPAPPLPEREKHLAPLKVTRLADVQPEGVSWLWKPYIPLGKLTLLEGDPGVGKSWLALAIATAVSLGEGLPGMEPREPANVLMASAEDGLGDTVRPRLDGMGGDVSKVFALEGPLALDAEGLTDLETHIARWCPALVVLDPLVAYLGAGLDLHRANETREVMAALARLAERRGCAIVVVRHLTKGARDKAIYRGLGSIDLTAACRSVLLVGADPEETQKRAIIPVKNNLAPFGPAQGYRLGDGGFSWTGDSTLTLGRVLAPENAESKTSALEEAVDFLQVALGKGERLGAEVQKDARDAGIRERTLDRAKTRLGIRARRKNKPGGKRGEGEWVWGLTGGEDIQEGQNGQGCQDSIVEKLASLEDSERKAPPFGQDLGTLGHPPEVTVAVKETPFDEGPGGDWQEAV